MVSRMPSCRNDRLALVMKVHLVDGTYELFRHFFGAPPHRNAAGQEVAAVRGVVGSVLQLLGEGATHVGVATDHVIESFRNDLWPGYKTGAGIDPDLWSQAWPLEEALVALGRTRVADGRPRGGRRPGERGRGGRRRSPTSSRSSSARPTRTSGNASGDGHVVQLDRRKDVVIDEDGVVAKFGVGPASIPDYLALVGDSADGFPGLAGWGAKSAAAVLARWGHLEDIPPDPAAWEVGRAGRGQAGRHAARRAGTRRCCSRSWRPCGSTARSSDGSRICAGTGPRATSPGCAPTSTDPACCRRAEALAAGALTDPSARGAGDPDGQGGKRHGVEIRAGRVCAGGARRGRSGSSTRGSGRDGRTWTILFGRAHGLGPWPRPR